MSSPSELSLDVKPHSYSMLLKSFGDQTDQTQKLEEFLARLEEERFKIDAFKRELPLCIQLLTNAMEASKQQLQTYRANQGPGLVLEEFIPIKHSSSEEDSQKASNMSDKATWMMSAQLWSQESDEIKQQSTSLTSHKESTHDLGFSVSPKLCLDTKQKNCGAFLPFSKERNSCPSPCLGLASSGKEMEEKKLSGGESVISCKGSNGAAAVVEQGGGGMGEGQPTAATNGQNHRKARRCWSPDLHRRFVNALQMLGGSQVATPKQIRELMKVDGLTNDEVKSHLQKYRLHTRRPSPSPQAAGGQAPQLVVLGGIWVPPEYATAAHGGGPATLYGVHPSTHGHPSQQHYCAPQVPQEFYHAPPPQQLHHHHNHSLHHQLHMYKTTSPTTDGSPDSDIRGVGNRSESIEDGKSESSSWKGDSGGENGGGERKSLVVRREDGE